MNTPTCDSLPPDALIRCLVGPITAPTDALRPTVVTETDQAVEAYIKDSISQTYPNFRFIGEESYAGGERVELTDEPTFIVDPIDGTTNFVCQWIHHRPSRGPD